VKQHLSLLAAACSLVLSCAAVAADEPTSADKIQAKLDALQKEIDDLKQAQQAAKLTAQEQPKEAMNYNRATITSADGRSSIAFRALVQADAAYYDQDPAGPLATDYRRGSVGASRENNAARDLSDGMYFRRARFGFEGMIARDFNYRLIVELGGAGTEAQGRINDAWISYSGFAPFSIQIGAFSPPANLDDGTPADETLFIERATPNELSRALGGADGRLGIGVRGNGTRWMGSLAYTSRTVIDPEVFDAQSAVVGRAGFLVMTSSNYNLHLGASATYVIKPPDAGLDAGGVRYGIRFRDRPELRVDSTRLIDTGAIDAKHAYVVGAELAGNWRQFYLQAENYWYGIERKAALDNPSFGGYYVQGSWLITGEAHRYNMTNAAYQSPRPLLPFNSSGGIGAWELAFRFSHMDLNFQEGAEGTASTPTSVRGGLQDIWTAGVNWYLTPSLRFVLEYQRVDVDRLNPAGPGNLAPFGAPPATPPIGVQIGQEYNAYALRSQFSF
jgi:phosphate-selective porin OprO/OprP